MLAVIIKPVVQYDFMEKVNDFEFDPGHPKELDEVVVTNEEFEKIEEKLDLDENIRFGDRGWDAPPGKVRIWVRKDDPEDE